MERIQFVPFLPAHLGLLQLQAAQAISQMSGQNMIDSPEYALMLSVPGLAETCMIDGRPAGAAGVIPYWPGRALSWALDGAMTPRAWVRATKRAIRALDRAHAMGYRRLEASVRDGFDAGHLWARRLGFTAEFDTPMKFWGPDGADYWPYVRIA